MVRVLAVSDVVNEALYADVTAVHDAELILACGDLPFEYLGRLMNRLDVPLVFVPGNHDPDVSGYRLSRAGLPLRAGLPARPPWPRRHQRGRPGGGRGRAAHRRAGRLPPVQPGAQPVHRPAAGAPPPPAGRPGLAAPPARRDPQRGYPAHARPATQRRRGTDPPHQGFPILNALTRWLRPALLLHGHVDPKPGGRRDQWLDGTLVRNVTGWQLMLIEPIIGLVEDKTYAR